MVKLTVLHSQHTTQSKKYFEYVIIELNSFLLKNTHQQSRRHFFNTALDSVTPRFKLLIVHAKLLNNFKPVPYMVSVQNSNVKTSPLCTISCVCQTSSSLAVRNPLFISLLPIITCDHATFSVIKIYCLSARSRKQVSQHYM